MSWDITLTPIPAGGNFRSCGGGPFDSLARNP